MLADLLLPLLKPLFIFCLFASFILGIVYTAYRDHPLLDNVLSHWSKSIPQLQGSAREFYIKVEASVNEQAMPDVVIRRVEWNEAGVLSDKREYLRVRRGDYSFDLCVARFGYNLFVSSWLCAFPHPFRDFCAKVPVLSFFVRVYIRLFDPDTYYRYDSAGMFQGAVHSCVLAVLDEMTAAQGLEPIPEIDRKPVMRELYGRRPFPA